MRVGQGGILVALARFAASAYYFARHTGLAPIEMAALAADLSACIPTDSMRQLAQLTPQPFEPPVHKSLMPVRKRSVVNYLVG